MFINTNNTSRKANADQDSSTPLLQFQFFRLMLGSPNRIHVFRASWSGCWSFCLLAASYRH